MYYTTKFQDPILRVITAATILLLLMVLGVKLAGSEADHSPPSSAEVKNAWSYASTPQYVFMAWCLVKHRDKFIFTFYRLLRISCQYQVLWKSVIPADIRAYICIIQKPVFRTKEGKYSKMVRNWET
jgi:hypothetical protein